MRAAWMIAIAGIAACAPALSTGTRAGALEAVLDAEPVDAALPEADAAQPDADAPPPPDALPPPASWMETSSRDRLRRFTAGSPHKTGQPAARPKT